ncbi:hypothetical protein GOBAR_AA31059 [Gossypium barbadense]|uniref:Cation-transporting P-type ATPase C-terminal domain-containing protein n=1 Tax=Gossypium barbadense TaxID=3634 RepID=A0A2P5WEY2_GOSBA|nr:hypothetical protein GOBAR_AA31059 [Gossypium barbadense]
MSGTSSGNGLLHLNDVEAGLSKDNADLDHHLDPDAGTSMTRFLVTGVGINTEWGLLMASISEDTGEETPLQVRLNGVATFIGIVGLSVAVSVLAILLARYFTGNTEDPDGATQFIKGRTKFDDAFNDVVKIFTIAVTIVVVAVPEGLPLAVTLTLAYSMRKMMADKALANTDTQVRRLSACETMGSATTICSDKTGTLTLNEMTVVEAFVGKKKINPPADSSQLHLSVVSLLSEGVAQSTMGNVFVSKDGGDVEISGSPTEKAILSWAIELGMKFDAIRSESTILHVLPFNSEKKRGGVALRRDRNKDMNGRNICCPGLVDRSDAEVHIHWKGAAEIVLAACSGYLDSNGCLQSMNEDKEFFEAAIDEMAANCLRCIALAYRLCEQEKVPSNEESFDDWVLPEDNLVLLAIVGIKDPCRPGVKDAVKICTDAGVKVRMVTGDNIQTAQAIALECGILSSAQDVTEPTIIEGRVFRALTEIEREQVARKIMSIFIDSSMKEWLIGSIMQVMGRSSPNDKLLLVQALRKGGDVVAVTGDGTNDAPALHEADIGLSMGIQGTQDVTEPTIIEGRVFRALTEIEREQVARKIMADIGLSMGIQGTEVAKESSDIVILDDNFASVVKVVRWGRSVYANIQKFIQFQLTVNVAALVINVAAAISSGDVPLNSVQLLWVNLIMDTLGALALVTEPPTDNLMHRSPVGRSYPESDMSQKLYGTGDRRKTSRISYSVVNLRRYNIDVESSRQIVRGFSGEKGKGFTLLFNALYQVTVLLVLNFRGMTILQLEDDGNREHAYKVKNSLIFNAFVMCQIFNEFNARKPEEVNCFKGVTKNYLFMGIIGFTFILQIIIIEFLGKFTSTVRLDWQLWLVSLGIGIISWPLAIVGKLIPVPKTPVASYFIKPFQQCKRSRDA